MGSGGAGKRIAAGWRPAAFAPTCVAAQQAGAVRRHHARIPDLSGVSHPHVEGAAGNVAAVELDVDGVDAVLAGNEAHGGLV